VIRYIPFIAAAGGGGGLLGLVWYEAEDTVPALAVTAVPSAKRDEFAARLSVSGVETFDGTFFFEGVEYPFESAIFMNGLSVVVNGVSCTFDAGQIEPATAGRFNTTSGGSLYVQIGGATTMLSLAFDVPIAAFGTYLTDVGDFDGQVSMVLHKSGGGTITHDIDHTISGPSGGLMFVGFVDDTDTYTQVDYIASNTAEAIGIDDMRIATAAQLS
jgi:hypothetical protein